MYGGPPPPGYPSTYGYPSQEQQHTAPPPHWMNNYVPAPDHNGNYPPPPPPTDWYSQPSTTPQSSTQAGPSSQAYHSQPLTPRYANGGYPPPQQGFRGSYTSPQSSSMTPDMADPTVALGNSNHVNPKEEIKANNKDKEASKHPKKKRKKGDDKETTSPTEAGDGQNKEKRTKTGRACDACRTKKIRCDILTPPDEDAPPICAHCKQHDLGCTFYMPITETRFKKRKQTEETPDIASINNALMQEGTSSPYDDQKPREVPIRMEGPTSLSFLLTTSLPAAASEAYDLREHNKWEVSEDGTGMIRVSAPPSGSGFADAGPDDKTQNRLTKPVLSALIMSELVNSYFEHIAPLFPVVSKAEFISKTTVSPLLLYAICGLGATRRQFPREIFAGVRGVINGLLRSNDILSDARFENVQALLLLAQVGDLHAQPTAATASASLIRMATAIRMAQDLGLHRESTVRPQTAEDLAFVELRRRVWATCVIMDRWYGAALGIPLLVDLLDCDVLLPAPYEIKPNTEPSSWPIEPSFCALSEHLKLSILVGRVLKTVYSPTGLKNATDEQLHSILADMTAWRENLPEELRFKGPSSSHVSGLLHLAHAALQFLFWRVFMRIQYTCPPHLSVRLHLDNWSAMVKWSTESIQWLAANDDALDTLFIYPYTATSCALIQYHTWARRRSPEALETLKLVKETATKWEKAVQPDQMSIRRKTCETMTLLYEAALKTNPEVEEPKDRPAAINPTAGVLPRASVGRIVWIKDNARQGGGIWVAETEEDRLSGGVAKSDCLTADELEPGSDYARQWAIAKGQGVGEAIRSRTGVSNGEQSTSPNHGDTQPRAQTISDVAQSGGMQPANHQPPEMANQSLDGTNGSEMFSDVQHAKNVNPQMNFDEMLPQSSMTVMGIGSEIVTNSAPQADGTVIDMSLLDGLPMNGFDFPSWEQYFQAINGTLNESFGGMQ